MRRRAGSRVKQNPVPRVEPKREGLNIVMTRCVMILYDHGEIVAGVGSFILL